MATAVLMPKQGQSVETCIITQWFKKKGDKVTTRQKIGQVYSDPAEGASELHLELWKGTTKLNPTPWLASR